MTAKELERILARLTGFGTAHLDQTTRALRAAGLLPPSPRGRGATPLTGADIATILIALAGAEQPAKTPAAARAYAAMVQVGGDARSDTLAEALTRAAVDPARAARIQTVLVCRSWPMATISVQTGGSGVEEVRYLPAPDLPPPRIHEAAVFCGLSGRLLTAIAERMSSDEPQVLYAGAPVSANV
jgi:hypothetical protein